jgi:hypothetical protein
VRPSLATSGPTVCWVRAAGEANTAVTPAPPTTCTSVSARNTPAALSGQVSGPGVVADEKIVLRKEALRRGRGKPHMREFLHRVGGTTVYVCRQHPNGLIEREYVIVASGAGRRSLVVARAMRAA